MSEAGIRTPATANNFDAAKVARVTPGAVV